MEKGKEQVYRDVRNLLRRQIAMALATESQGVPWVSILFYASYGLDLYFMGLPEKRFVRNIAANPRVAVAIVDAEGGLSRSKGLQIEGVVEPVTGARERLRARAVFLRKLARSGCGPLLGGQATEESLRAFRDAQLYRVRTQRLWFTDNSKGLGHRVELAA
jgi:uncharacterized protein YhbP (UPF0306 family)